MARVSQWRSWDSTFLYYVPWCSVLVWCPMVTMFFTIAWGWRECLCTENTQMHWWWGNSRTKQIPTSQCSVPMLWRAKAGWVRNCLNTLWVEHRLLWCHVCRTPICWCFRLTRFTRHLEPFPDVEWLPTLFLELSSKAARQLPWSTNTYCAACWLTGISTALCVC